MLSPIPGMGDGEKKGEELAEDASAICIPKRESNRINGRRPPSHIVPHRASVEVS